MSFKELLGLWAVVSVIAGFFLAISHQEVLQYTATYVFAGIYIAFSLVIMAIVESVGPALTNYMVGHGHPRPRSAK